MLNKIRSLIGNYRFKKEVSRIERKRKITNLQEARKIGILYTLNDLGDYDTVSEFVTKLQHERKEVKALGFVKNRNLVTRFLPRLSYDFFSRKDIGFFYKPIHAKVKDFMEKEFDILIDLNIKESLPLKYIAGLSMAWCRVGRFSEENTFCYDLMIDINPGMSIQDFIKQITHYLTIINSDEKGTR